jgi:hypothetical protein
VTSRDAAVFSLFRGGRSSSCHSGGIAQCSSFTCRFVVEVAAPSGESVFPLSVQYVQEYPSWISSGFPLNDVMNSVVRIVHVVGKGGVGS